MSLEIFLTITGFAFVDAINVCAMAVLAMVLTTILIQNPNKKRNILYSGIAFSVAVFIMYFIYGVIIHTFFKGLAGGIRGVSAVIYNIFVILIIVVGALNIKDFFYYKKGSLGTEMPLFMRPKVKKIINKISSPKGAFVVGIIVTLFLLPCTMLPLFGAINKLSAEGYTLASSVPWLLYYNLIFVLPMLLITFLIYFGFAKVDEVSGWKDRNIRILHLIAGLLLFFVGLALLLKWI